MGKREGKGRRGKDRRVKKRERAWMFQSVLNAILKMRIRIRAGSRRHRRGGVERRNQMVSPQRASAVGAEAETSPIECVHLDLFVLHI